MTLIYSLGIFVVMMPIVLGAKALQEIFFDLHDQTYLFGGVFMLIVAVIAFFGIKLPMPHISLKQDGTKNDIGSTFILGVFSGITSACCAPVLIGAVALSTLTPTTLQALGVGASYVLGMVTPLYIASLFIHKKNILERPILKKVLWQVVIGGKTYPIFVSNVVATTIFALTGSLMLWLTSIGKLGMTVAESTVAKSINGVAFSVTELISGFGFLDAVFAILGIYLLSRFWKKSLLSKPKTMEDSNVVYTCPMHPEVISDKPGKCPKCGGMDLVPLKKGEMEMSGHGEHGNHDHQSMMASPQAPADFLRRFWVVTGLLLPLVIFSTPVAKLIPLLDIGGRSILEFGIATVIFYVGLIFFRHAKMEIAAKQLGMMTLVSLGVGAGYVFSAVGTFFPALGTEFYLEVSTLIWVLLFGHYLEAKSSSAAGDALGEVAKLLPKLAHLKLGKGYTDVVVESLKVGDIVRVKAGEKVPADAVVMSGKSAFNESHLTGESRPVVRGVDDKVVAGAIALDGSVDIRIERVGASSTIGQIQQLISQAKQTKPAAQKLADKASRWLTFTAIGVSAATFIVWSTLVGQPYVFAATLAITVLVIACPHALGLAIPTVSTIATKLAVRNGLFIKDMAKIEVLKKATYVVFDKTGTLTEGEFAVEKIIAPKSKVKTVLQIAASLEEHSAHVIGLSIVEYAKNQKVKVKKATNVKNIAGKGIEGQIGDTKYFIGKHNGVPVAVVANGEVLGEIVLADKVKSESMIAVSGLHDLGIKVVMLTGDTKEAAQKVAAKLKIDRYFAEVKPHDKYKHVQKLQQEGGVVVMVGDGVNDAPALTQADVGVAIGAGTDVAVESGDVVLTQSNPQHIVRLIKLSRRVYTKMVENLFWAFGYNVLAIPAAAGLFIPFGFRLSPAVGALAMSLSSVIVVANALGLRNADVGN